MCNFLGKRGFERDDEYGKVKKNMCIRAAITSHQIDFRKMNDTSRPKKAIEVQQVPRGYNDASSTYKILNLTF